MYYSRSAKGFFDKKSLNKPKDCVKIKNTYYQYLLAAESKGEVLHVEFDDKGVTVAVNAEQAPIATQKTNCCAVIDRTAGQARKRIVSNSDLIEFEYEHTYQAAKHYISNNYQGDCPSSIKSHAEAFNTTEKEAADTIKATGDNWYKTLDKIRDIRLKGKKAIENAPDDSDFEALAQSYIDQLNAIAPEQAV